MSAIRYNSLQHMAILMQVAPNACVSTMASTNAIRIGTWALWAAATAVVLFFGVFHLIFDTPPQGIMSRATETLFAPLSLILIGLSMWFENERLRALTAAIALFSIILNIAFAWTTAARFAGIEGVSTTETYFTEAIASIAALVYLIVYLQQGTRSKAP